MTVEEARRGQSVPSDEVILGNPAQQWKIIGNGVERRTASAIGVNLREAWIASHEKFSRADMWRRSGAVALAVPGVSTTTLPAERGPDQDHPNGTDHNQTKYSIRRGKTVIVDDPEDEMSSDSDVIFVGRSRQQTQHGPQFGPDGRANGVPVKTAVENVKSHDALGTSTTGPPNIASTAFQQHLTRFAHDAQAEPSTDAASAHEVQTNGKARPLEQSDARSPLRDDQANEDPEHGQSVPAMKAVEPERFVDAPERLMEADEIRETFSLLW